jgi:starch synthase
MKKILFVTSEVFPLIKTGGLADVSASLPIALNGLNADVRLLIPYYKDLNKTEETYYKSTVHVNKRSVNILETFLPETQVLVWLVDCPALFDYPGNPYVDEQGNDWLNNAERFALFCRVAVELAMNRAYLDWMPDVVHCNDWQSGLVPALLSTEVDRPSTVFTIHNLAYQGLFPKKTHALLNLPRQFWHPNGIEFNGMLSFMKGGLAYADRITTVSPTYAQEIQTAEFGYGLEGLLRHRNKDLVGILNGIDIDHWNPETDVYLNQHYGISTLDKKQLNKTALQAKYGLFIDANVPVFALISRLVEQKGLGLIVDALPEMLKLPLQFVLLGKGEKYFEQQLAFFAKKHPQQVVIILDYDEALAHQFEAAADIFLMPSLFEPCGLNQLYSQRYGTVPIVRKTGGLADTVVDALPATFNDKTATGFVFNGASSGALLEAIKRSIIVYSDSERWKELQLNGMQKNDSWHSSAQRYLELYEAL